MRAWSRVALGLVVLAAAACTGAKPAADQHQVDEVRIGVLAPTSGKNRAAGTSALHGAQLAAALINGEEGPVSLLDITATGMRGLGGPKVTIVPADTGSDPRLSPERAAAEAVDLVTRERVVGLVGAYDGEVTAAASQRTERLGVPFVNGDASTGYLTERGLNWFFRTGPTDRMFGEAFFSAFRQRQILPRRITILFTTDAPGENMHRVLHNLAPPAGYDEHGMVRFTPGTANFAPVVQEVRAKRPEALFLVTSSATDTVRILKAFAAAGFRPPQIVAFGAGFSVPQALEAAGPAGEGVLYGTAWSREVAARNPSVKPVMDLYEKRFSASMTDVAAGSFTAVLTLAEAINATRSVEPERVRAALLGLEFPGRSTIMPWSGVQFDASHQNVRASATVEQLDRGGFQVVFPRELAQAGA